MVFGFCSGTTDSYVHVSGSWVSGPTLAKNRQGSLVVSIPFPMQSHHFEKQTNFKSTMLHFRNFWTDHATLKYL